MNTSVRCGVATAAGALVLALLAGPAAAVPVVGNSVVVENDGDVIATYRGNSASFSNNLYLSSPGSFAGIIFNNHASPVGSTVNLGHFTAGTELIFRLEVTNTGYNYFTGPASRNPDNKAHARVDGAWSATETLVEFEDLFDTPEFPGGFNDLSFSFSNTESAPVPEPGTYALLLAGLAGVFGLRRRQGSKRE